MDINSFFQSKYFKAILIGIACLIVLLLVFKGGMYIGFRKANFSYRWGENYHRVFGGPPGGFLRDFEGRDFISGHGTVGTIAKIEGNNIIIKGQDGVEKMVITTKDTTIRKGMTDIKLSNLKIDDQVVVIGSPNDAGQIEVKLIRVFPPVSPGPVPSRPFPLPQIWPR